MRVTKPAIWSRLIARFGLESVKVTEKTFSPQLVGVSDIDALLREAKSASGSINLTAGAGAYVGLWAIPSGKRWHINRIIRGATIANSRLALQRANDSGTFWLSTAGTAEEALNVSFILNRGDNIGMLSTGNAGDSAIVAYLHYEDEDAY